MTHFYLDAQDKFSSQVNVIIESAVLAEKTELHDLLSLCADATASKPSKKFLKETKGMIDSLGMDASRSLLHQLMQVMLDTPIETKINPYHNYMYYEFLEDESKQFLKGVVWTISHFTDKASLQLLEKVFLRGMTKVPEWGAVAVSVSNACVYTLGNMRGKDGLSVLSSVKSKVNLNRTKKLIDKQLDAGAKKYGISVDELAEMAVPEFGLHV